MKTEEEEDKVFQNLKEKVEAFITSCRSKGIKDIDIAGMLEMLAEIADKGRVH